MLWKHRSDNRELSKTQVIFELDPEWQVRACLGDNRKKEIQN